MRNNNSMKVGIVIAVLVLAVGFAAITTTLLINGTIKIAPDTENFNENVRFKKGSISVSVTGADDNDSSTVDDNALAEANSVIELSDDQKEFTYTTHVFRSIGETATLTYTIENQSKYGASVPAIVCEVSEEPKTGFADEYMSVTAQNNAENKNLNMGAEVEDKIVFTMKKSYVGAQKDPSAEGFDEAAESDDETATIKYVCKIENIQAYEDKDGKRPDTGTIVEPTSTTTTATAGE